MTAPAATLASGRCDAAILGLDAGSASRLYELVGFFGMVADRYLVRAVQA